MSSYHSVIFMRGRYEVLCVAVGTLYVGILQKGYHRRQQVSPLCLHSCGIVSGAGDPIPSAVGISSEAAVCTGSAVHVTLVELHLCYDRLGSNVELLLEKIHHVRLNS